MKKKNLIAGLGFALIWTFSMLVLKIVFSEPFTMSTVVSTLFGGIIAGLLFSFMLQFFADRLFKKIIVETDAREKVIKEGGANHLKGRVGVGGKLVLTDRRLIFKSHKINVQNHQDSFDVNSILKLEIYNSLRILENRLAIQLANL